MRPVNCNNGDASEKSAAEASLIEKICDAALDPERRKDAWNRFIIDELAWVPSVIKGMGVPQEDVDDVFQDVMIKVMTKIDALKDPKKIYGWINMITFHMSKDYLAKKVSSANRELPINTRIDPSHNEGPENIALATEAEQRIHAAIAELRPIYQGVTTLFYFKRQTMKEIADVLGIPLGTVKRRLNVVRGKLKNALGALE